jgi:glucan phosphoethanolaminetransferase (alkaline phosphatase superfamily)
MVFRIASIALRLCGALAVILGILFWSGNSLNLIPIHMLMGLAVVLSLWIVGIGQAFSSSGSWALACGALLLGLLVIVVGIRQSSLLVGPFHWVIQVVHLLLGILAVGIGQIAAARGRNSRALREEQPSSAA